MQWTERVRNAQREQSLWQKRYKRNASHINSLRQASAKLAEAYAEAAKHCASSSWRTRYRNLAQLWSDFSITI